MGAEKTWCGGVDCATGAQDVCKCAYVDGRAQRELFGAFRTFKDDKRSIHQQQQQQRFFD